MSLSEKGYTIRFAEKEDSAAFVKWAMENPRIDRGDISDSLKANNPTCVVIVVERDGVPVLFAPAYCTLTLAYLGWTPEREDTRERLEALEVMKRAMIGFSQIHGIREINTMTTADQMVAQWAERHEFKPEPRQLYRFKLKEERDVL